MKIAIIGAGNVLVRMALLNVTLQIRHGWPSQNEWKLVGPPND